MGRHLFTINRFTAYELLWTTQRVLIHLSSTLQAASALVARNGTVCRGRYGTRGLAQNGQREAREAARSGGVFGVCWWSSWWKRAPRSLLTQPSHG